MFYSQLLLSKKGALGIIWMAAHCHKRLKKDQVQHTNISSSVDKILGDEVPVVTHRILAFLLLGIVRIYSKKVEYLFQDCQEVLDRLHSFKIRKKARVESIEVPQRHYQSITLPKIFELDTFDLGLDQDAMGGVVRSHELNTRDDGRRKGCSRSLSFRKVVAPISEPYSTAHTPPRDVLGSRHVSRNISLADVEVLRRALCSLEDCVVDHSQSDESAKEFENEQLNDRPSIDNAGPNFRGQIQEQMHDNLSHEDPRINFRGLSNNMESDFVEGPSSLEILRGIGFALEDRLDSMELDEAEMEQLYDRPSDRSTNSNGQGSIQDKEFNSVENQSPKGSDPVETVRILHESDSSSDFSSSFKLLDGFEEREGHDKPSCDQHGAEEEHMDHVRTELNIDEGEDHMLEVIASESVKCQEPDKLHVPVLNSLSNIPADIGISEVAAVQTPGRKEHARILKKRKALIDEATVLPNKLLKSWIGVDPTDLKRGKKKTPTLFQLWKAYKLCHLPHSFLEPLIPGISVIKCGELSSGQAPGTHVAQEQIPVIRSPVAEKLSGQTAEIASLDQAPAVRSPDHIPIAPGTPFAFMNPSRCHEDATVAEPDISEPSVSLGCIENLDALLQEGGEGDGDRLEKGEASYSVRTRMAGSYLARKFLQKKRRKELKLSHLLEGKTKRESSIMFYEILVLKSLDCIDVQQETAFSDIILRRTPKLGDSYFK